MAVPSDPQRYDDRLSTILGMNPATRGGPGALWQQLIDMLAQADGDMAPAVAARALTALTLVRPHVDPPTLLRSARALADRCRFAPLAVLMAGESASVVVAFFDRLNLDETGWLAIVPAIGPLARSRLRLRAAMLPPAVGRALAQFAAIDFTLPSADNAASTTTADRDHALTATVAAVDSGSSIAGLVQRIEQWRHRRSAEVRLGDELTHAQVRLLIDSDGVVRAVDGLPRAAMCGLSIADPARPLQTGVDAGVARAFAKRSPIAAGRLLIAAGMPWSGCWSLTAAPQFDQSDGRFVGYVAEVSPMTDDPAAAAPDSTEPVTTSSLAETMRAMMHELRSPLNAVSGFAQLIHGQFFGPVADGYRTLAKSIEADAAALLHVFEDLDDAARLDLGGSRGSDEQIDAIALLRSLIDGDDRFALRPHAPPVVIAGATSAVHSLFARLFRMAVPGDRAAPWPIDVTVSADGIAAIEFGGGFVGTGDGDAGIGDGFSHRIAAQLAQRLGGTLAFGGGKALLNLRCATPSEERFGSR